MKIKYDDYMRDTEGEKELANFIADEMNGSDHGQGQLETIEATSNNVAKAFGKLINCLAEKNILDIKDIKDISGTWDEITELKK